MSNYYTSIETFVLISARISPLFIGSGISPFSRIPVMVRAIVILIFSFSISTLIGFEQVKYSEFYLAILNELLLGGTLLLVVHAAFSALLIWGRAIDMQMGLGAAAILNPGTKSQDSLTGTIVSLVAVTIFFISGTHLFLLEIIVASFDVFNLGSTAIWLTPQKLAAFWGLELVTAMMIFAPVMIVIWSLDIIVGMLSKTMPQVNIYFVTLPLKIAIGLGILSITIVYARQIFLRLFEQMSTVLL